MNLAKNDSYREEEISADDTGSKLVEEVKDIFTASEADEEIDNLEEEEVAIIEEIEVLEIRQKDKLPALRHIPVKKILEENCVGSHVDSKVRKILDCVITVM